MLIHVKVYRDGNLIIEGEQDFDSITAATEYIQSIAFGEVEIEASAVEVV